MNSYEENASRKSPVSDGSGLPASVPERRVSAGYLRRRRPKPETSCVSPPGHTPDATACDATAPREGNRTLRMAILCVLLTAGAAAVLLPAWRSASGGEDDRSAGDVLGGVILNGGLPPLVGIADETDSGETPDETSDETSDETPDETSDETFDETPGETLDETSGETSDGVHPPEDSGADTDAGTDTDAESETVTDTESDSALPDEPDTDESDTYPESEGETDAPGTETDTEPETDAETETMPEGAFSIVRQDLSEPERSVGYIHSTADRLPASIPGEGTWLWSTADAPTVLIVHTHPYEGYHDGSDWYDPAAGTLAQTDSVNAPDGVVALGASLTRILREAGATVIHLRVPVAEGESAAATYARTEETVRYYCEIYPDIGLVLDLRRSAELTEDGDILRTAGTYGGEDCAQVRISVSGDRATDTVSRDIAVAVALRHALWAEEPTVSRPVWVKSGAGLVGDCDRVAMLTLELGSAGNSFAQAERLLTPLGEAILAILENGS